MLQLYFAPNTRAVRIVWLLEELGLPYELKVVEFIPPAKRFFGQNTPTGKLPTLVDGDVTMCESGAMVEYIIETYAGGRLAPPPGTAQRAPYLQWLHYAEATAFPPLGIVVWLGVYRQDAASHPELIEDARQRAASGLDYVENAIGNGDYLLGEDFSAADIMMGFTLVAARMLGVLDGRYPRLNAYVGRLEARPAFKRAMSANTG